MGRKHFRPRVLQPNGNGEAVLPAGIPAPLNVVYKKDAETAARIAYATGRRDAMVTLAEEMKVLDGQFIAVTDMVEAIEHAAEEFTAVIERMQAGDTEPQSPEAEAAAKARERIILPS